MIEVAPRNGFIQAVGHRGLPTGEHGFKLLAKGVVSSAQLLRQVADQLSALRSIDAQRADTAKSFASENHAYQLALARYRSGLSNRLTVLVSETQLLGRRMQVAELRARRLDAAINLVHALGGGFENEGASVTTSSRKSTQAP